VSEETPIADRFLAQAAELKRLVEDAAREHRSGDPESQGALLLLEQAKPQADALVLLGQELDNSAALYGAAFLLLAELSVGCVLEARQAIRTRAFDDAYGPLEGLCELLDGFLRNAADAVQLDILLTQVKQASVLLEKKAEGCEAKARAALEQATVSIDSPALSLRFWQPRLSEALRKLEDEDDEAEDITWQLEEAALEIYDALTDVLVALTDSSLVAY
jgi:hypothetical protein